MVERKRKATKTIVPSKPKMVRKNRITIGLNDRELEFIEKFYKKYNITNRSNWLRETIILAIYKRLEDDAPGIFDQI